MINHFYELILEKYLNNKSNHCRTCIKLFIRLPSSKLQEIQRETKTLLFRSNLRKDLFNIEFLRMKQEI